MADDKKRFMLKGMNEPVNISRISEKKEEVIQKPGVGFRKRLKQDTGFQGGQVAERMFSRTFSPRYLASVPNIQPLRHVERDPRRSEAKKLRLYFSGRV